MGVIGERRKKKKERKKERKGREGWRQLWGREGRWLTFVLIPSFDLFN